jgi:hypothetical protein
LSYCPVSIVTFAPQRHSKSRSTRTGSKFGIRDTRVIFIVSPHPRQTGGFIAGSEGVDGIHDISRSGSVIELVSEVTDGDAVVVWYRLYFGGPNRDTRNSSESQYAMFAGFHAAAVLFRNASSIRMRDQRASYA